MSDGHYAWIFFTSMALFKSTSREMLICFNRDFIEQIPDRTVIIRQMLESYGITKDFFAAFRHTVTMRAEHDSRQALIRALHMADDIAKRILAQLHACLTHQPHQIRAPSPVRIRERQPVDHPPRRRDFVQSSELLLQALFGNHESTFLFSIHHINRIVSCSVPDSIMESHSLWQKV